MHAFQLPHYVFFGFNFTEPNANCSRICLRNPICNAYNKRHTNTKPIIHGDFIAYKLFYSSTYHKSNTFFDPYIHVFSTRGGRGGFIHEFIDANSVTFYHHSRALFY